MAYDIRFSHIIDRAMIKKHTDFRGINRRTKQYAIAPDVYEAINPYFGVIAQVSVIPNDFTFYKDLTDPCLGYFAFYIGSTQYRIRKHGSVIYDGSDSISTGWGSTSYLRCVQYHDLLFMVDGSKANQKYNGTTVTQMGITAPSVAPTVADKGSGEGPDGTYYYYYTYYNSSTGHESAPSPVSAAVTVSDNTITVSVIADSDDDQVDYKRIYRTGGTLSPISYVGQVANSTTTYDDSDTDITVALNAIMNCTDNDAPPTFELIERVGDWLYAKDATNTRRLYRCRGGIPEAWPSTFWDDIGEEIMGLRKWKNELFIYTRSFMKRLIRFGTGDNDYIIDDSPILGTEALYSPIETPYGVIFPTTENRIVLTKGFDALDVGFKAQVILDSMVNKDKIWAEFYDNKYYMAYCENALYDTPNKVMVIDFDFQPFGSMVYHRDWKANVIHKDKQRNLLVIGQNDGKIVVTMCGANRRMFKYRLGEEACDDPQRRKTFNAMILDINTKNRPVCIALYVDGTSNKRRIVNVQTSIRERNKRIDLEPYCEGYVIYPEFRYMIPEGYEIKSNTEEYKSTSTCLLSTGIDQCDPIHDLELYGIYWDYDMAGQV